MAWVAKKSFIDLGFGFNSGKINHENRSQLNLVVPPPNNNISDHKIDYKKEQENAIKNQLNEIRLVLYRKARLRNVDTTIEKITDLTKALFQKYKSLYKFDPYDFKISMINFALKELGWNDAFDPSNLKDQDHIIKVLYANATKPNPFDRKTKNLSKLAVVETRSIETSDYKLMHDRYFEKQNELARDLINTDKVIQDTIF